MAYGVPDDIWYTLTPQQQAAMQNAVESARFLGQDVAAVKATNLAQAQGMPPYAPTAATGGYDTSGGNGGGYSAPAGRPLASSPEWLAYLNSLGLERNQFEADIARQRGLLSSEADRQTAALGPGYQRQREGIAGSLSSRGMSQSGELLKRLAQSRASQGEAQSGIQANLTSGLSSLESSLAQKLIDIGARQSQEQLTLQSQGYY